MLSINQQDFLTDYRTSTQSYRGGVRRLFRQEVELIVQCNEDPTGNFKLGSQQVCLDYIFSIFRRKGNAREAMTHLVNLADKHLLEFGLVASAYAIDPHTNKPINKTLSQDKLVEWYESFGFVMAKRAKRNVMWREPGALQGTGGFTVADFVCQR